METEECLLYSWTTERAQVFREISETVVPYIRRLSEHLVGLVGLVEDYTVICDSDRQVIWVVPESDQVHRIEVPMENLDNVSSMRVRQGVEPVNFIWIELIEAWKDGSQVGVCNCVLFKIRCRPGTWMRRHDELILASWICQETNKMGMG